MPRYRVRGRYEITYEIEVDKTVEADDEDAAVDAVQDEIDDDEEPEVSARQVSWDQGWPEVDRLEEDSAGEPEGGGADEPEV